MLPAVPSGAAGFGLKKILRQSVTICYNSEKKKLQVQFYFAHEFRNEH